MPQGDGGPIAAVTTGSRIEFAPITGTTREVVAPLTQQLAARARERGIGIAGNGAFPTHILKGYFSEVDRQRFDHGDLCLGRARPGRQQAAPHPGAGEGKGQGGWAAVTAGTMQAIADRTIDEFAQWLSSRAG